MPKGNYNSFHCSNIFCKFLLKLIFRIRFVFLNIFRFNFFIFDFLLSFLSLYFHIYFFLLKSGPSWPLFIYFCLFDTVDNKQVNKQMSDINFADDWSQTADHWYWKRPLYQLGHNHFPHLIIFYSIFLFCKLWPTTASLFYLKISLPSQFNDKLNHEKEQIWCARNSNPGRRTEGAYESTVLAFRSFLLYKFLYLAYVNHYISYFLLSITSWL